MRATRGSPGGDQLSLELEGGLSRLPETLRPMVPRPIEQPFDSAEHLFEPAWGGRRALAFLEPAVATDAAGRWATADGRPSVRLVDARGRDLLSRLPELQELSFRLDARSAILDGEIVVVGHGGRADGPGLRQRLAHGGDGPVAFLVFDLPYLDGRPLLAQPLRRRRELLARTLRPGPEVVTVPAVEGEGIALYAAVVAQGLGGVLARVASSPYLPGVRSVLWRSVRAGVAPVVSAAVAAGDDAATATGTGPTVGGEPEVPARGSSGTAPAAPLLAVIRRLPLDETGEG
jgi:ATP dependent DNA ligase domain